MNESALREDPLSLLRNTRLELPLRNESLTQHGKGALQATACTIECSEGMLYHARIGTASSTLAELSDKYTGIVLPLHWNKDFSINGEQVDGNSIYTPVDGDLFLVHGHERETIALAIDREEIRCTIAALRGVGPDEIALPEGKISLPPLALRAARASIAGLCKTLADKQRNSTSRAPSDTAIAARAANILIDLYIMASTEPQQTTKQRRKLYRIIRQAEDYFESVRNAPVSLADLCAATNVSQGTLYHAFAVMVGTTPITHFKNRRLTQARLDLLHTPPSRGLIKRTALIHGLTHLGRFSQEYHTLFGEFPSATLNIRAD